jgi:hypothetical protein
MTAKGHSMATTYRVQTGSDSYVFFTTTRKLGRRVGVVLTPDWQVLSIHKNFEVARRNAHRQDAVTRVAIATQITVQEA